MSQYGTSPTSAKLVSRPRLIIWGNGGHANVVQQAAEMAGWEVSCRVEGPVENYPDDLARVILGFGDRNGRIRAARDLNWPLATIIHPRCLGFCEEGIGAGSFLAIGSSLGCNSRVGKHCIINTCASVDHDCELEDHAIVGPGARLCGGVLVGSGAYVGAGAVILPRVRIGAYATIGAGSVVVNDVPSRAVVVGSPARVVRYVEDGKELPC